MSDFIEPFRRSSFCEICWRIAAVSTPSVIDAWSVSELVISRRGDKHLILKRSSLLRNWTCSEERGYFFRIERVSALCTILWDLWADASRRADLWPALHSMQWISLIKCCNTYKNSYGHIYLGLDESGRYISRTFGSRLIYIIRN